MGRLAIMKWSPITSFLLCLAIFLTLALLFYQRERRLRSASPRPQRIAAVSKIERPPHSARPASAKPKASSASSAASITTAASTATSVASSASTKSEATTPAHAGSTQAEPSPKTPERPASSATATGATITGKVYFRGTAATEKTIDMAADAACKAAHDTIPTTRHYVVNPDATLQNVFVYVKSGAAVEGKTFPPPKEPVELDQKGCLYSPYVLGVQVGQDLLIVNSDATLHNVHAQPTINEEFNKGQPVQGMKFAHKFTKPEFTPPVRFKCDVHPWMFAYVAVVPHPFFAITRETGSFTLKGLPAGTYTIEAWHPKAGTLTNTVTVGANDTKEISLEYK